MINGLVLNFCHGNHFKETEKDLEILVTSNSQYS